MKRVCKICDGVLVEGIDYYEVDGERIPIQPPPFIVNDTIKVVEDDATWLYKIEDSDYERLHNYIVDKIRKWEVK